MDMLTERTDVVKVEDNLSFDQEFRTTEDVYYHNTLFHSPLPKDIDTDENEFQVQNGDLDHQDINQKNISSEHNMTNDLLYKPTTSEDYVTENIEAEDDHVSIIQTKDTTDCNFVKIFGKNTRLCHESNKPFNDKANGTEQLITHTATKSYSCNKILRHNSNLTEKTASGHPLPRDVAIDGIKLEYDDSDKQSKNNQEHLTNNDMFGGSTTTEDFVIDDIKFENDNAGTQGKINTENKNDYDSESETITTEDCITDNIKVKIKQEIITAEDFTNIDMICRSSLPADVGLNSVKVETCAGMNKVGVNESATNADVKVEGIFMGEDYSSDDNIPLAEEKAKLSATAEQHVTKIPNDSSQVKVDTRRGPAADGGLTVDKLSCDICPYQTNSEPQLLSHLKAHAAVHKNRLQGQIKLYSSKKTYSCDVCSKKFSYKSKLTVHLTTHFRGRRFSCKVCHKTFSRKAYLTRHMITYSGEKPFPCKVCHKTYRTKSYLACHMRTHSGEKPFSCEVCHKTFSFRSSLACHIRTHSREMSFSCDVCHKTFNAKSYLARHMRTHSVEKPFSCEVCHKTYSTRFYLAYHMRSHSGEKPFSCEVCHKTFSMRSKVTRHMSTHSRKKLFSCEITGIHETADENPVPFTPVAQKVGVSINERDIVSAERRGKRRDVSDRAGGTAAQPTIVVRLARTRRGADTAGIVATVERVTRDNRRLFDRAREQSRIKGWKYVWIQNGRIFARCDKDSPAFRIRTDADIEKVFNNK